MGGIGSGRRRRQSMETYIQIRVSKAEKKDLQERLAMQGMDHVGLHTQTDPAG